ncbi:MAG: dTDP-4-dehydrorhamnose 3,5-epimerase family protein [Bacteroidetes bacterium]|nr:dTDP-4-dehydrorhamnose 3,5-epimerase family protein [Bacteroidota bacterium]
MDNIKLIDGLQLSPLRVIPGELGDVYHGLKATDVSFQGFGEAYFSTVHCKAVKGWKMHTRMVLNLIVPVGAIRFVCFDNREDSPTRNKLSDITLSVQNYQRLTVPPLIWMAFQGVGSELNMLLNVASLPHDPGESISLPLNSPEIPFSKW